MIKRKKSETGYSLPELLFVLLVVIGIGAFIYSVFLTDKSESEKAEELEKEQKRKIEKLGYQCLTTASGLIPLKVVTVNPNRAILYRSPNTRELAGRTVGFFRAYFVFEKSGDFYRIGNTPTLNHTIGWVQKSDVLEWSNREALRLKCITNAPPILIWEDKGDIGHRDKWLYKQRTDIENKTSYPILEADKNRYKIAFTWQTNTWDSKGVDTGWTGKLQIPRQAEVTIYITRKELQKRLVQLLAVLKELKNKPYSDHPIIQLFKEDLGITFGRGLSLENESIGFLKRVAREAPEMPEVFKKQPAEIRSQWQRMSKRFNNLRRFYENRSNWDERGGAWIPMEWIPGN